MFYVYILRCSDRKLYIGYTNNIRKRYRRHQNKEVLSTRYKLPVKLIFCECFTNKKDAKSREVYLKSGPGREQLRKILKNTLIT